MADGFEMDPDWVAFQPNFSRPSQALPPGAVDTHCHVFGPGDRFPYAPERRYTPSDAGKDVLFQMRDYLGFDKNVVVQATCHGSDNSALLDALRSSEGRARGVVVLDAGVSDSTLMEMHDAGVRGVRFVFVPRLADPEPESNYYKIIDRISPLGWHTVVFLHGAELVKRRKFISSIGTTVVVDHMAVPDFTRPIDGPEFSALVTLMEEHSNIWTKVSVPPRPSDNYDDAAPFARLLVDRFPDRVIWGTDFPHPSLKGRMGDGGAQIDFAMRIASTDELRKKLLVDNPTRLYWDGDQPQKRQAGT